ncbi:hypothetical protein [Variovorax atrisoli]|uniref:hypothetical protein n=1 Tax=Variovorax atrisoli TaxID=3394203 RepID=UPI0012FDCBD4|nr:hypothetical protein [Variovorax paradoxus]
MTWTYRYKQPETGRMKQTWIGLYLIVARDVNDAFAGGPYFWSFTVEPRLEDWVHSYSELGPSGPDIASAPIDRFHMRTLRANEIRPLDLTADLQRLSDFLNLRDHGFHFYHLPNG